VVPDATPVTTPVASIVATAVVVLPHTPPDAASLSGVVVSSQTDVVPVIVPATGNGSTVTTVVAAAVPQLFVTV
jgi:hypothetical protein